MGLTRRRQQRAGKTLKGLGARRTNPCLGLDFVLSPFPSTKKGALRLPEIPCEEEVLKNGAKETRTPDPLHAMQVLYQLSYGPISTW